MYTNSYELHTCIGPHLNFILRVLPLTCAKLTCEEKESQKVKKKGKKRERERETEKRSLKGLKTKKVP